MQFVQTHQPNMLFNSIGIEFEGQIIHWDLTFFHQQNNTSLKNTTVERVFLQTNQYLSTLSRSDKQKLFNIYQTAKTYLDDAIDPLMLMRVLASSIKQIFDILNPEKIRYWAKLNANVVVPETVAKDYNQLDISKRNTSSTNYRITTYLQDEYLDLAYLLIGLKALIPIWGEYGQRLIRTAGPKSNFYEYQILASIGHSKLVETDAYIRLREYIEYAFCLSKSDTGIDVEKIKLPAALKGLGSSEFPDWLMATAMVRKLIFATLHSAERGDNLVSVIYVSVDNKLNTIDRSFLGGRLFNKSKPGSEKDDDVKSIIEGYKIKQEISDGDLMVLSIYCSRPEAMLTVIEKDYDPAILDLFIQATKSDKQLTWKPSEGQLNLLRWIISPALSPNSIDNINKPALLNCFAVAQTVLYTWGYIELALLLTASPTVDQRGIYIGGIDAKSRIPNEYVDRFKVLYPHYQQRYVKDNERQQNMACRAIDTITKSLVMCDWHVNTPLSHLSEMVEDDILISPREIKNQLSAIVLQIAENQLRQE